MTGHVRKHRGRWHVLWELPRDPGDPAKRVRKWSTAYRTQKEAKAALHEVIVLGRRLLLRGDVVADHRVHRCRHRCLDHTPALTAPTPVVDAEVVDA